MAEVTRMPFGDMPDGKEAVLYTLRNTKGTEVDVTSFGARLVSWRVFDRDFHRRDIVLGFKNPAEYLKDTSMGAIVGRCANRIAGAKVEIDGKTYALDKNSGENHIHGGFHGFHSKLWDSEITDTGVRFTYISHDGEGGYPGTLTVHVTYGLSNDNELSITYEAESDADTICNLTNHAYFNLAGENSGDVLKQQVQFFADTFTWSDKDSIPDGRILPVDGTPLDLRNLTEIGAHINDDYEELVWAHGYDHNYVVRDEKPIIEMRPGMFGYDPSCPIDYVDGGLKKAAYAICKESGISLTCYTTQPGVQFYTGNYLKGLVGKSGAKYTPRTGFCFETQFYPNAVAHKNFPQPLLRKGDTWRAQTVYTLNVRA